MSIFNRSYKNDKEMETEEVERKRREKYHARKLKLNNADMIYKNVLEGISRGNKKEWTKKEMIESVRGLGKFDLAEWVTWNKYCNIAIGKIRREYWNGGETEKRMFNYQRSRGIYVFIDVGNELATGEVCRDYNNKMRALQKKDLELRESVYYKIARLTPAARKKLIEELLASEKNK